MAVFGPALTSAILAEGQAVFPGSQTLPRIALAVGNSVPAWLPLPTNVLTQGITSGVLGGGTTLGKLFFAGGAGLVIAALAGAGMVGVSNVGLGKAVGNGVESVLNAAAQYSGTSFGVGSGQDTTKVSLSNAATLISILLANLLGSGVSGAQAPQLATGLGTGIANLVQTGFGFGGVVGPAFPIPAAGTSISLVF